MGGAGGSAPLPDSEKSSKIGKKGKKFGKRGKNREIKSCLLRPPLSTQRSPYMHLVVTSEYLLEVIRYDTLFLNGICLSDISSILIICNEKSVRMSQLCGDNYFNSRNNPRCADSYFKVKFTEICKVYVN